jgi:hypothetical protein
MKKLFPILFVSIIGCSHNNSIDKEKFSSLVKNYYLAQTKDIKSIEDVSIDSIVAVTERRQLEDAIGVKEKKYYYFIEAKDDEYADSTAKDIEQLQQNLKTADNTTPVFYTVYHTVKFIDRDMIPRRRQSNLDVTTDYEIRPNAVTEKDKIEGVKAEKRYKSNSY